MHQPIPWLCDGEFKRIRQSIRAFEDMQQVATPPSILNVAAPVFVPATGQAIELPVGGGSCPVAMRCLKKFVHVNCSRRRQLARTALASKQTPPTTKVSTPPPLSVDRTTHRTRKTRRDHFRSIPKARRELAFTRARVQEIKAKFLVTSCAAAEEKEEKSDDRNAREAAAKEDERIPAATTGYGGGEGEV
ncbi:hypothetical protein HK097_003596 [Rhizophlyctis rosea]|uniref:Uncharacterized protein n=1 Tax=Rhizophlyctis rosea TaxID=64517 RepID=A0AAD5S3Y4_9FUNG|nr:hypothetical protein HK097_003596 [Rhizophlyctis rosea]